MGAVKPSKQSFGCESVTQQISGLRTKDDLHLPIFKPAGTYQRDQMHKKISQELCGMLSKGGDYQ